MSIAQTFGHGAAQGSGQTIQNQSYALMVRDAIYDRLKTTPFFQDFTFAKTKALAIQPEHIPFCGIYFISELGLPDGDANAGEVRFRTTAQIGFSIIVLNNNDVAGEAKADAAYLSIMKRLMNDPTLYNGSVVKIQAFTNTNRAHNFGTMGKDNSLPILEMQFHLTCDLGVIDWPPIVTDGFETMHVTTQFPSGGTPDEIDSTQQVQAEYDLEQNP
jgi:hypothetical protein